MFWRMQNDDRYLIHTSLRRLSEETYSMRQMLGLTHVGLSHRWPALNVESSSITFRLKLKALSTAAKGLLSLVPQVIYTFPCWGIALDVPSVCNAFPPDSHVGGSIICWLNKLFQVGCLRTFQEKKSTNIHIIQSMQSCMPHLHLQRRNLCSSRLRLFTSFLEDDFFIIWVLIVCSRKLKKWRGILQGNHKWFLPRGTQLVEAETLSLGILRLWPGLQLTDSISSLRHTGWASTLVLERPRVDRAGWGKLETYL